MLNGISNGMRMNDVLVMGTFGPDGFLVCPYDDSIPFDNWITYMDTQAIYAAFVQSL